MTLEEDLNRVRATRVAERERIAQEQARLQVEEERLLDAATSLLGEATDLLSAAGVPMTEARLAHKQRQAWQWPAGRARVRGWRLACGDQPMLLRSDGWLAAIHECSDRKRTLCACTFVHASSPLPEHALGTVATDCGGELADGDEARTELTVRTKLQGDEVDLPFNAWLTEQVADLLDSASPA